MPHLEATKDLKFSQQLAQRKQVVFVLLRQVNTMDNIVGVYSDVDQVITRILEYTGSKYIVVTAKDLEKLELDGDAIIATKVLEPELRVARCMVDPHIGSLVLS